MMRKILVCLLVLVLLTCFVFSVSAASEYDGSDETDEGYFEVGNCLLISFGAGLLIALIAVCVMYGQLKSVRRQRAANSYTKPGSMNVTNAQDIYLYRNVTKVAIQQNNSNNR